MPETLEYEEEDLFDAAEDDIPLLQVNAAVPIAGPSYLRSPPSNAATRSTPPARQRPPPAPCPPKSLPLLKSSVGLARTRPRLLELKELREVKPPELPRVGPVSLKQQCMAVVKANAIRIWDIGDAQYGLMKDFIDELPAEQLAAIEEASPHIRKDTDWLWEYFLLVDFAAAHERYAEKHGERRTSGWRRTYKKAAEEARERQANAAERVAERYREMDKERADKRIVVLNQVVQPGKSKRISGGMFGAPKPLSVTAKPTGLLGKARADAQRARIAMTHASGKFIPPSSRHPPTSSAKITPIPTLGGRPAPKGVDGPRIPPPRPRVAAVIPPHSPTADPMNVIPGARPNAEYLAGRANLPSHLAGLPALSASLPQPARFSTDIKRKFSTLRQPEVPNFKPPDLKSSSSGVKADFFGSASSSSSGVKRRRSVGQEEGSSPMKVGRSSGDEARSARLPSAIPRGVGPPGSSRSPGGMSAEASAKLKGIMFRSKPRPKVNR